MFRRRWNDVYLTSAAEIRRSACRCGFFDFRDAGASARDDSSRSGFDVLKSPGGLIRLASGRVVVGDSVGHVDPVVAGCRTDRKVAAVPLHRRVRRVRKVPEQVQKLVFVQIQG